MEALGDELTGALSIGAGHDVESDETARLSRCGDGFEWSIAGETGTSPALEDALAATRSAIERYIAEHSPTHVFVHAGVVAVNGAAIVLPGSSFAGKTTLVRALVDRGATYYSDEYAALDASGLVHAFPRPVNIRADATTTMRQRLDGGGPPIPVYRLLFTRYFPGGVDAPKPLTAGEAILKTMEHTVCAQTAPERALEAITNALVDAEATEVYRGDAREFARQLLAST